MTLCYSLGNRAARRWFVAASWLYISMLSSGADGAFAQAAGNACGELANAYGPYDYRSDRDKLPIVDHSHFTPEIESLSRSYKGYLGGELDYALRAFPNHHRALAAMMRLAERSKSPQAPNATYSVACYFDRAIRFRPNDTTVRMLFASYLNKSGLAPEANQQLDYVLTLAGDNAFTHYNLGLLYFENKSYDKALQQAHRAMALGLQRSELRDALKAAGKWIDPVPGAEPTESAASGASNADAVAPIMATPR